MNSWLWSRSVFKHVIFCNLSGPCGWNTCSVWDFAYYFSYLSIRERNVNTRPRNSSYRIIDVNDHVITVTPLNLSVLRRFLRQKLPYLNPRLAGGGGGAFERPLRFFEDSENTAAQSAAGFSPTLPPHVFRNFCENFDPRSCKIRSPGQVKWPNYKITFQSRHGYNVSGKVMKLLEYDEVISAYKTYISDFFISVT